MKTQYDAQIEYTIEYALCCFLFHRIEVTISVEYELELVHEITSTREWRGVKRTEMTHFY